MSESIGDGYRETFETDRRDACPTAGDRDAFETDRRDARPSKRPFFDKWAGAEARPLVVIELTNGSFFGFPPRLGPGLQHATASELAEVEVSPSGEGLYWERLDADLHVPTLLQSLFGTRTWMRELGRVGGRARSAAKARAARANGAKGGRPVSRSPRSPR